VPYVPLAVIFAPPVTAKRPVMTVAAVPSGLVCLPLAIGEAVGPGFNDTHRDGAAFDWRRCLKLGSGRLPVQGQLGPDLLLEVDLLGIEVPQEIESRRESGKMAYRMQKSGALGYDGVKGRSMRDEEIEQMNEKSFD